MQASPATASWPMYTVRGTAPGLYGIETNCARVDAAILAHPYLVPFGTAATDDNGTVVVGSRFKASPTLTVQEAEAIVKGFLDASMPGTLEYYTTAASTVGSEIGTETRAAADSINTTLRFVAVAAVALAVVYLVSNVRRLWH